MLLTQRIILFQLTAMVAFAPLCHESRSGFFHTEFRARHEPGCHAASALNLKTFNSVIPCVEGSLNWIIGKIECSYASKQTPEHTVAIVPRANDPKISLKCVITIILVIKACSFTFALALVVAHSVLRRLCRSRSTRTPGRWGRLLRLRWSWRTFVTQ